MNRFHVGPQLPPDNYGDNFKRLDNALKDYATEFPVKNTDYSAAPGTPLEELRGMNYDIALDEAVGRLLEDYAAALYDLSGVTGPDWVCDTVIDLARDATEKWRQANDFSK